MAIHIKSDDRVISINKDMVVVTKTFEIKRFSLKIVFTKKYANGRRDGGIYIARNHKFVYRVHLPWFLLPI